VSTGLGAIPPVDPSQDAARRGVARRRTHETGLFVVLLFGQMALAALLGGWAAAAWPDPSGTLQGQAGAGFLLVLLLAHAVGYAGMLLLGGVALLASLPRLFMRRPPDAAPAPPSPKARALDTFLIVTLVGLHAAALFFGALLLCSVLALSSDAAGFGAWWRFALAALLLVPVTARLLLAWSRAEPL
jgi:hypothetical protein